MKIIDGVQVKVLDDGGEKAVKAVPPDEMDSEVLGRIRRRAKDRRQQYRAHPRVAARLAAKK